MGFIIFFVGKTIAIIFSIFCFSFLGFSQVCGDFVASGSSSPSDIINYRGQRKLPTDYPLEVLCSSLIKKNDSYYLTVYFNQSVAPEKITGKSVFFNGKNTESSVIIKFNRKSDSVTIIWSQSLYSEEEINDISIQLKNVQTFDGKFIEELKVK